MKVFFSCFKHWSYDFHLVARYLFGQEKCLISSHFSLKILVMFTKLNPEPTDKWSVLKSDKLNYSFIYLLRLALLVATCPSEMDSLFLIHSLYTELTGEGRFLLIVYAHQFFTPGLHTRLPYGRRGSGLANCLAYNMPSNDLFK